MKKTAEQFVEAVKKYQSIAIYIPGSPDPDALASAYAIREVLKKLSIAADIFAEKGLSLTQNQAFIECLDIPVLFGKDINIKKYNAYIVPDFQNNRIENVSDYIPCAAHLDHHGKSNGTIKSDFTLLREDVGSTSTLVALIIKHLELGFTLAEIKRIATALTFGLQTDTDKYNNIGPADLEAIVYLSQFADMGMLENINSIPPSVETLQYYKEAREHEVVYKDWAFYGIGYVDAKNRDSIAIVADMLLQKDTFNVVAVFAIIENHKKEETYLDVSLRAKSGSVDLNRVIKRITPNGGGRKYKGAYQVKLNYLKHTPDRDMLWQVVEAATLESLRKSRDDLYVTKMKHILRNVKDKIASFSEKVRSR